ncbi:hypothetical protein V8G54_004466, partial [Vigna mungo]
GTDLGLQPSPQTQLSSDRNQYHGEEEEEGFLQGVVLLLRSRIRRREDLGAASESEALQVSRLPQEALNRQRHGHPRPPEDDLYPCHQMLGWFRLDHSHGFHNLQLFQFLLLPHTHSSHYFLCRMSGLHCQQLLQQHCKLRLLLLDCLHLHRSQFHNLCSLLLETTIQRLKVQHILLHLCPQVFHQLLQ